MFSIEQGTTLDFTYLNWQGQTSKRKVIFEELFYGSNEWHKEPQFLLKCFDLDKANTRFFAIKDISDLEVNKNKTFNNKF